MHHDRVVLESVLGPSVALSASNEGVRGYVRDAEKRVSDASILHKTLLMLGHGDFFRA